MKKRNLRGLVILNTIIGVLLCFTIIGAPIGLVMVWGGYWAWNKYDLEDTSDLEGDGEEPAAEPA